MQILQHCEAGHFRQFLFESLFLYNCFVLFQMESKIIMSDYWWADSKVWISTQSKRVSLKEAETPKPFLDPLELPNNSLTPKGKQQVVFWYKLENL